jgi:hypothetical protein
MGLHTARSSIDLAVERKNPERVIIAVLHVSSDQRLRSDATLVHLPSLTGPATRCNDNFQVFASAVAMNGPPAALCAPLESFDG